jgi:UDP-N-acetylglucosamine--dolichyl-phosphate N-acetylglucosaminephosphotransferase
MPFPKAVDQHKPGNPLVPNCYGIFYALPSVCYWFLLVFLGIEEQRSLALTTSVLFGSTMGLFDDLVDLPWRYKAVLPIFASLPYMVLKPGDRTTIYGLFIGVIELGSLFFLLLVPVITTVTVNTYNQLGGLNGLEALSGLIVLFGLMVASSNFILLGFPIACLVVLAYLSFRGKAFIGNVGSFSVGLTMAIYAILMNLKLFLLVSLAPFILNSVLILFSAFFLRERADTMIDNEGKLYSNKVRSLRTLLLHKRHVSEQRIVLEICGIVAISVIFSLLVVKGIW